jgi:cytochrome b6-f complex iron-sulfur subunit
MAETNPKPEPSTAIAAGAPPATTAVAAAPPPKAAPPKPVSPVKGPPQGPTRRFFLESIFGSWITFAWITFSASMAAMFLYTLRFLFPNVLSEPPSTFRAGFPRDFDLNKVEDKFKEVGAWVIHGKDDRNREIIYALSTTCTHLGCNPNWLEAEKKFKCPCHGSGFRITGINFEGPAPRPLERYAIRKADDDQVIVDKSRKFQKELGQWDDPDSFILL